MTTDSLTDQLASLATAIADWQRSACNGRGVKTAREKAERSIRKLFLTTVLVEPTPDQVAKILATVGLV